MGRGSGGRRAGGWDKWHYTFTVRYEPVTAPRPTPRDKTPPVTRAPTQPARPSSTQSVTTGVSAGSTRGAATHQPQPPTDTHAKPAPHTHSSSTATTAASRTPVDSAVAAEKAASGTGDAKTPQDPLYRSGAQYSADHPTSAMEASSRPPVRGAVTDTHSASDSAGEAKSGNSHHNMSDRVTMHHHGNEETLRRWQDNPQPVLPSTAGSARPFAASRRTTEVATQASSGYMTGKQGQGETAGPTHPGAGGLQVPLGTPSPPPAPSPSPAARHQAHTSSPKPGNNKGAASAIISGVERGSDGEGEPGSQGAGGSGATDAGHKGNTDASIHGHIDPTTKPASDSVMDRFRPGQDERRPIMPPTVEAGGPGGDPANLVTRPLGTEWVHAAGPGTSRTDKSDHRPDLVNISGRHASTVPSLTKATHTDAGQTSTRIHNDHTTAMAEEDVTTQSDIVPQKDALQGSSTADCSATKGPACDITKSSVRADTTTKHSSFITHTENEDYTEAGVTQGEVEDNVVITLSPTLAGGVKRSRSPSYSPTSTTTMASSTSTTSKVLVLTPANNPYPSTGTTGLPHIPTPSNATTPGPARQRPSSRRPRTKSVSSFPRTHLKSTDSPLPDAVASTPTTTPMVAMGAGLPSNSTLAISASPLGTAEITGIAMACLVVFWLILGPLICLLMRTKDKNKSKRRERLRGSDSMSHVLVEEMIRMELARGRAKMYRTNVHDEREIQRLPCNGYQDSPAKHSISVDGITALRNHCSHSGSPLCTSNSYERTPFALACMSGSGSGKERHLLSVQNNLCYDGTPNKEQLEQLSRSHKRAFPSDPSSVHLDQRGMVPARSEPLHSSPPPPLPPRVPLRRKAESDSMPLSEKSTQTPPWEHRHRRRGMRGLHDAYSPQVRHSPLQQVPPVPKPRKTKSPNPKPRKPPRKGAVNSPQVPKVARCLDNQDSAYVDCLLPQRANGHLPPRSPQRLYNFDKMNGNVTPKPVVDIIRDINPLRSPLIPRTTNPYLDNSSEKFYESDRESEDSQEKVTPTSPWTYLPENNLNIQRIAKFANHAYVPIHDTKL